MTSNMVFMPTLAQDTLAGSAVDAFSVPMSSWPDKPTGVLEARDQVTAASMDGGVMKLGAAAVQQLPEVQVFEHINFGGATWRTNLNYLYVGDFWNDKISSIIIVRGRWRFYQHRDYKGAYWDLSGPAYYPWVEAANIPNDIISSFRFLG